MTQLLCDKCGKVIEDSDRQFSIIIRDKNLGATWLTSNRTSLDLCEHCKNVILDVLLKGGETDGT